MLTRRNNKEFEKPLVFWMIDMVPSLDETDLLYLLMAVEEEIEHRKLGT